MAAAKTGRTVNLASEYDCQNLFYISVNPWLKSVGREEVEIIYDKQKKISDFNFFHNQLIVEMKYIDDNDSKREIIKDLKGLQDFYSRKPKCKCPAVQHILQGRFGY
jgi:REase_DpnII-MboI